jgi:hypothetical protein
VAGRETFPDSEQLNNPAAENECNFKVVVLIAALNITSFETPERLSGLTVPA